MTNEAVLIQVDDGKLFAAADPDRLEAVFGEYQSISDRANRLLSRQEDFYVAFKRSISGLESDDLVSFANSKKGGAILIGVNRTTHGNGRERVALVGCTVGDREQLRILAKASQCVPPVPVSIFVENRAEKPFYRIEVPSGPHKPYCTSGGTYKTRGDGRNEMLYPAEILALFREMEGGELSRRFQQATTSLGSAAQESIASGIRQSLEALAKATCNGEGNAADIVAITEGATECSVRLSSQDLCGFLMRMP
ncbi:MAG: ATP-binding protein [Bryobacteraceae bacterium]|jgi:hypothetical protein